ncbi:unnamed protein product [Porites lobata]|uniref:Uncharacterized protein n=1 Tax=Porites lobata TaxID=104759 RepID=A0ABN8P4L9_9CNID|nr:unnamed protein product [Porites lobata]
MGVEKLHDHDAPCAVCFVESRGSMLMIPARNDCPSEWTEEYHGYLMTEHYNHQGQKDFICAFKSFNQLQIYQACFLCNTVRDRKYVMQPELSAMLKRLVSVPTDCSKFNRQHSAVTGSRRANYNSNSTSHRGSFSDENEELIKNKNGGVQISQGRL